MLAGVWSWYWDWCFIHSNSLSVLPLHCQSVLLFPTPPGWTLLRWWWRQDIWIELLKIFELSHLLQLLFTLSDLGLDEVSIVDHEFFFSALIWYYIWKIFHPAALLGSWVFTHYQSILSANQVFVMLHPLILIVSRCPLRASIIICSRKRLGKGKEKIINNKQLNNRKY